MEGLQIIQYTNNSLKKIQLDVRRLTHSIEKKLMVAYRGVKNNIYLLVDESLSQEMDREV